MSQAKLTGVMVSRAFGTDTEAGRLLKKLYCGAAKPQISYPSACVCDLTAMPECGLLT